MVKFISKSIQFLKDVAKDERIPSRDKKLLLVLIALIVSPVDLIPDWIPIIGILDDLFIISLILDYFFRYIDSNILLSHYPFGMKSFSVLRNISRVVAQITPQWLRRVIWKYEEDLFTRK